MYLSEQFKDLAAILAIVIGVGLMNMPMRIAAKTVAEVSDPRIMEIPYLDDYKD